MSQKETVEQARRRKQAALAHRMHQADCPDKFRAIAQWWRLDAEESAVPQQALTYAANQAALAEDMERRPGHYRFKPLDKTAWQWSQIGRAALTEQPRTSESK